MDQDPAPGPSRWTVLFAGLALAGLLALWLAARFTADVPVAYETPVQHFTVRVDRRRALVRHPRGALADDAQGVRRPAAGQDATCLAASTRASASSTSPAATCRSASRSATCPGLPPRVPELRDLPHRLRAPRARTRGASWCPACRRTPWTSAPSSASCSTARRTRGFDVERLMAETRPWRRRTRSTASRCATWACRSCASACSCCANRFRYLDWEPPFGPGRVDTWPPAKVLLNFPLETLPSREIAGASDFPSVWLQRKRKGMSLHWDGNNDSVEERNRSAAFGTGAFPPTLDRAEHRSASRTGCLTRSRPLTSGRDRRGAGRARPRRSTRSTAPSCHGRDGRDFTGGAVGTVSPIERIRTDRRHLDSYSFELSLVAEQPVRRLRRRALLALPQDERLREPAARRRLAARALPAQRLGADAARPARAAASGRKRSSAATTSTTRRVGFVSEPGTSTRRAQPARAEGRAAVLPFAVDCRDAPEQCDPYAQVRRRRHAVGLRQRQRRPRGPAYGTELPRRRKDALVEYLKTF